LRTLADSLVSLSIGANYRLFTVPVEVQGHAVPQAGLSLVVLDHLAGIVELHKPASLGCMVIRIGLVPTTPRQDFLPAVPIQIRDEGMDLGVSRLFPPYPPPLNLLIIFTGNRRTRRRAVLAAQRLRFNE
jgi:hypothetical protein